MTDGGPQGFGDPLAGSELTNDDIVYSFLENSDGWFTVREIADETDVVPASVNTAIHDYSHGYEFQSRPDPDRPDRFLYAVDEENPHRSDVYE